MIILFTLWGVIREWFNITINHSVKGPLHSNWVGLQEPMNQSVIDKRFVQLTIQTTLLEKTLEDILKNIDTQVLETKYVINLR